MIYRQKKRKKKRRLQPWIVCLLGGVIAVFVIVRYDASLFTDLIDSFIEQPEDEKTPGKNNENDDSGVTRNNRIRKAIFDRNMEVLAASFRLVSVYLRPLELRNKYKVVGHLAELLDLDSKMLLEKLRTERSFVWLKRNLSLEKVDEIAALKYSGAYLVDEIKRYYPYQKHAGHVIGFVKEEQGLAGVEFTYNNVLRGQPGLQLMNNFSENKWLDKPLDDGAALVLSLDIYLQVFLEEKLQELLKKTDSKTGMAIIMDASTGGVLAMANIPSYDPNIFWEYENYEWKNRAISDPIYMAGLGDYFRIAAELSAENYPAGFFTEKEAELVLRPFKKKIIKGAQGTEGSQEWNGSDTSVVSPEINWQGGFSLTEDELRDFCLKLRLTEHSGIDLPEFVSFSSEDYSKCELTDPYLKTTSLNLLTAFSQLVNGGRKLSPHVVNSFWKTKGKLVETQINSQEFVSKISSRHFVDFLETLQPPSFDEGITVESLMPVVDSHLELELGSMKGDKFSVEINEPDNENDGQNSEQRYKAVLLGGNVSHESAKVTVLISVDNAHLSLKGRSPLKKAAVHILAKSLKVMENSEKNVYAEMPFIQHEDLYKKWSKIHEKHNAVPIFSSSLSRDKMPDVRGLSLRKALQTLQEYNVRISIKGSGRVIEQSLQPGVIVEEGSSVTLRLQMDN